MKQSLLLAILLLICIYFLEKPFNRQSSVNEKSSLMGRADVHDGDSFRLDGQKIRLYGIDAPELDQICQDEQGQAWPCGVASRDWLIQLTQGQRVHCAPKDTHETRIVASCYLDDKDISLAMVMFGMALPHNKYGGDYESARRHAQQQKTGIWKGSFMQPWQWREGQKQRSSIKYQ